VTQATVRMRTTAIPPFRDVRGNASRVLSDRQITTDCGRAQIYVLDSEFVRNYLDIASHVQREHDQ
jgi:hypothetical protein